MKALGGSYLKFFTCKQSVKDRVLWRSRELSLSRQEIGFLGNQKRVRDCFSLAGSFQNKYLHTISAASSAQTNVGSEEIQTTYSDHPKTVRVRFKLQKECAFGQQFLIVGDDPIVGLWDPSDGLPLTWSEGHVWTAEMVMPIGKEIKYKFILKAQTGNVSWQPGPDRILETWDTNKIITVVEDWDDQQLQNIIEEDSVADVNEESLIDSDSLIVAENLSQPVLNNENEVIKKLDIANGHTNMVAENITEEFDVKDSSLCDKGSDLMSVTDHKKEERASENDGSKLLSLKDEIRLVEDEHEVPVLVPGLVPMPVEEIEEAEINKVEDKSADNTNEIEDSTEPEPEPEPERIGKLAWRMVMILGSLVAFCFLLWNNRRQNKLQPVENNGTSYLKDEYVSASVHSMEKTSAVTQLKDEHVSASMHSMEKIHTITQLNNERVHGSPHSTESNEMKIDEEQRVYGTEKVQSNIFERDMRWGRRTLQKFLANLGFQ